MIYGDIERYKWIEEDVTANSFKVDLDELGDIQSLDIYINSNGGDVFQGQAIYSMLKRHKAFKTVYIDGIAASISSVIAMAGDKVVMPSNAMMMIHNPWSFMGGNSQDFRKMADDLDKIKESIMAVYVEKSGQSTEKISDLMDEETWLTGNDAYELGLVDEIEEEKYIAASLKDGVFYLGDVKMDLNRYKNTPKIFVFEQKNDKNAQKTNSNGQKKQKELETSHQIDILQQKLNLRKKKYNIRR